MSSLVSESALLRSPSLYHVNSIPSLYPNAEELWTRIRKTKVRLVDFGRRVIEQSSALWSTPFQFDRACESDLITPTFPHGYNMTCYVGSRLHVRETPHCALYALSIRVSVYVQKRR